MKSGLVVLAALQAVMFSPSQLAHLPRPLRSDEIRAVLTATRETLSGRMFTLTYPDRDQGPWILMRADGRPARMRTVYGISGGTVGRDGQRTEWHDDFIDIVDYTGIPAHRCDGAALDGELVITYQHRASTDRWTARAATTALDFQGLPSQIASPIFNMLSGATLMTSEIFQQASSGHALRAFSAPVQPPVQSAGLGDPSSAAVQSLWIDADSLLPTKWEVAINGRVGYEMVFNYRPLDVALPDGVDAPTCIP